jgi:predicted porin
MTARLCTTSKRRTPYSPCALSAFVLACSLGSTAQAQSSVTLSGFLDIGVFEDFDEVRKVGTVQRSHIALDVSEQLAPGLKATVRLQHRLEVDTGASEGAGSKPFWHGESTVGLQGGMGHLRLGRALDVVSAHDWTYDPWANYNRIASPAWNNWHWNYASDRSSNNGSAEYGRLSDGVFYDSPSLAGFTVHLSQSFEDPASPGGRSSGDNSGWALRYGQAAWNAMLARSRNSNGDTVHFAGLAYNSGGLTLMGAYDISVFRANPDSEAEVVTLGLSYNLGATTWKAGWGRRDVDGSVSQFVGLGADLALSKRSTIYTSFGRQSPRGASARTAYGVGISHAF